PTSPCRTSRASTCCSARSRTWPATPCPTWPTAWSPGWTWADPIGPVPATMTAYRIVGWGQGPQLTDVPVPEPGRGEVLVEVAGNGLCHSDLSMAKMPAEVAEALGWHLPFTLGHEIAGRLDA